MAPSGLCIYRQCIYKERFRRLERKRTVYIRELCNIYISGGVENLRDSIYN